MKAFGIKITVKRVIIIWIVAAVFMGVSRFILEKNEYANMTIEQKEEVRQQKEFEELNLTGESQYLIQKSLHDPSSYKYVNSDIKKYENGQYAVSFSYRANNRFGALVLKTKEFWYNKDGDLLKVVE